MRRLFALFSATTPEREVMFSQEVADAVCERLAAGMSLRAACRDLGGPNPATILRWKDANEAFAQQYTRAREVGYQLLADEIIEISDDSSADYIETDHGPKLDAEAVARSRLRVDSRKWMLSKMLPKVYGDKLELGGEVSHTVSLIDSLKALR